jgi:hypothetical protein
LGADTWEITDGLKASDYIVWPSDDCRKGAPVQKNIGGVSGGMTGGDVDMIPMDGEEPISPDGFDEDIITPDGGEDLLPEGGEGDMMGDEENIAPLDEEIPGGADETVPGDAGEAPADGAPETEAAS